MGEQFMDNNRSGISTGDPSSECAERERHSALAWCHIYAQHSWHSTATIEGTRSALLAIRAAIDAALSSGMDGRSDSLFTGDGEGYHVEICIRNYDHLSNSTMPYISPIAFGIGRNLYEHEIEMQKLAAKPGSRNTSGEVAEQKEAVR